ncbi:MAG: hypothetical protein NC223_00285 [Butyrivibrio sp.]|nr:hypothetical protein [Butyrivibrio sp.]
MKKSLLFGIAALTLASVFMASGCAMKKSSNTSVKFTVAENEEENAKYKSLIEKYAGKQGEQYKVYDKMKHDAEYGRPWTVRYSEEEWLDGDGRLIVPFDPEDFLKTEIQTYEETEYQFVSLEGGGEHYYISDEIAAKASTDDLAEAFMSYAYNTAEPIPRVSGWFNHERDYEHAFAYALSLNNILEECLRRDDFAAAFFEIYMSESENMPEQCDESGIAYYKASNKIGTLDLLEVLLAQPEAYGQLIEEQRVELAERVLEREKQGEQGKIHYEQGDEYRTYFFACIAGELYLSADMAAVPDTTGGLDGVTGAIRRNGNPWLDTLNAMDLNEEECRILGKYFSDGE